MDESEDGVHYGAACQGANLPAPAGPQSACPLPPAVISYDEGIPGNVVVNNVRGSKFQHRVYAIHTDRGRRRRHRVLLQRQGGRQDRRDRRRRLHGPDADRAGRVANGNLDRKNVNWHDSFARAKGHCEVGQLFPAIAQDSVGNLYATWSEYPAAKNGGTPIGAGSIKMSVSRDGARTGASRSPSRRPT